VPLETGCRSATLEVGGVCCSASVGKTSFKRIAYEAGSQGIEKVVRRFEVVATPAPTFPQGGTAVIGGRWPTKTTEVALGFSLPSDEQTAHMDTKYFSRRLVWLISR
jgi:hypothetical protein